MEKKKVIASAMAAILLVNVLLGLCHACKKEGGA